ncbi:MAG TPA: CHASE3 domain-containing protein, partial [Kofleriaceae bacterium]|nr:CHASE3 domain-containing protein [Kofleriaceae bacterium]
MPVSPERRERRARAILPPKTLAALIAAVGATLAITFVTWQSMAARGEAVGLIQHTHQVLRALADVPLHLREAESAQRSYLIAGSSSYRQLYDTARAELDPALVRVRALTADNPEQQQHVDRIEPAVRARLALLDQGVAAVDRGDRDAAFELVRQARGFQIGRDIEDQVEAMISTEQRLMKARTDDWDDASRSSRVVMFGGAALLLAMLAMLGWLASRDFRIVDAESWIRRQQVALAGRLQADLRVDRIGEAILDSLVPALGARVGAVYAREPDGLHRVAGHALEGREGRERLAPGEGLAGEAARDGRLVHLRDVP